MSIFCALPSPLKLPLCQPLRGSSRAYESMWVVKACKLWLSSLTVVGLALSLWGCPEQVTALDVGPATPDQAGGDERADRDPTSEGCFADDECARGQYCERSEEEITGSCVEGCRLTPDSCTRPGSNKVCDAESRTCVLSCMRDQDCYEDQYCAEGRCETGCRLGSEAAPDSCNPEDGTPQRCDEESRTCLESIVCCDLDDVCSVTDNRACEQVGGEILLGVLSCMPDPCRTLCSRDGQCPQGEYCADYGRCTFGCRVDDPNGCPMDLSCDPEQRSCVYRRCEEDVECPDWQYCHPDGRCRDGCRVDSCPEGLTCDDRRQCRAICQSDEECEEGQYCEVERAQCRAVCTEDHRGCEPGEACVAGRCEVGCADDLYEADDTQETAREVEWLRSEVDGARVSAWQSRVLCKSAQGLEEDWLQLTLAEGERVALHLVARPSSGPLQVSLLNAQGETLVENDPWLTQQTLRYPPLNTGITGGEYWVRVRDAGLIEPHPYEVQVQVTPTSSGCFSDQDDPIDDTVNGARLIGLTPSLRFTESAEGDLCAGDRDHFCFPMSLSDGLDLYVEAPAQCDPLQVSVATSQVYSSSPQNFTGYRLSEEPRQADETRVYLLNLDPETSAFSNDEWCIQVSSEGQCEGYRLNATFMRRQVVCSDLLEPNNSLLQATPLDGAGPLSDQRGEIPNNLEQTLNENVVLCQGDLDHFSLNSARGDAWRAWIIDDSDLPDAEIAGRGQLTGELRVRFLNSEGVPVGDSATINPRVLAEGEALQYATAVSAADEQLFIEVSGVEDSAGPYRLKLLRTPSDGACSQDVNEPVNGDDELNPVSLLREESPQRFAINNGYLCDEADNQDEDWFTFEVAENNTRLCLNSTFRHRDGDINVELFEAGNINEGQLCGSHADCRADQAGSSCINRRCRAPLARANSLDDGELIHFSSLETQAGRYYARVYSPDPVENAYQLAVTLVPPSTECVPDVHEGVQGNNRPQDAVRFGSGRVELCDGWLCAQERTEGDWYEITVPASAQRTIYTSFELQQGRLTLSAEDASSVNGQVIESPRSQSRNVHCINVAAGIRPATVRIHVGGDVFNLNQSRVDYILRVVPTDLTATPRGACDQLSGGLFNDVTWPLLNLGQ